MSSPSNALFEHPVDVMRAALDCLSKGQSMALALMTNTEGGGVRAPGAMMAIDAAGNRFGYLSGGCIDADVAAHAQAALASGEVTSLRYGANSPFLDIRLPCGGAIDVSIFPSPDAELLERAVERLEARQAITLYAGKAGLSAAVSNEAAAFKYTPKLKLRIAGRGADPVALARLAAASGIEAEFWSPDEASLDDPHQSQSFIGRHLKDTKNVPASNDDAQTAFVLMFHDAEWEPALLEGALNGDAFFVGAVGSKATHARRCDLLAERGVSAEAINRIRAPIGLVPSMRDASMLAVSAFAEIIDAFHHGGDAA